MQFVKRLQKIGDADKALAGGKGAALGKMMQAGLPVPGGFVILTTAFEYVLHETNTHMQIQAMLDTIRIDTLHTIEYASEYIQGLIMDLQMPAEIETQIKEYQNILDAQYVAVRSSATVEDGTDHSRAGQLESYLNTTPETLMQNVKRCRASLFSPKALFYRYERHLNDSNIGVAVVVQSMVQSEKSGIAFSVHPVTKDSNQIIIEAGFGLGEAIVLGEITPDSYVIEKNMLKIQDIKNNIQQKALYKSRGGGNERRNIDEIGQQQVLSEEEIIQLSQVVIRIENYYGFPCDIERAYESGEFFIVQSRPITTLVGPIIGFTKQNEKDNNTQTQGEDTKITTLLKTQISLSERYEEIGSRDKDVFRVEDNAKRDRLKVLSEILGIPYDKPTQFSASDLTNRTKIFQDFLEEHGYELCALRLIPQDKSLPKMRMRGKSIREVMPWYDEQRIDPSLYVADFVPHSDNPIWCMTFVITNIGIVGEAVRGGHYMLTQGFFEDIKPLTFHYDFVVWNTNYEDNQLLENVKGVVQKLYVENGEKQRHISKLLQGTFVNNYLIGYFEAIVTQDFGLQFLDYNRLLDKTFSGYAPVIVEINDKMRSDEAEIQGQVAYSGVVRGKVYMGTIPEGVTGAVLICSMTTPAHISSMQKAIAIVTDKGGILSHAAIIARELHVPCIVGTTNATTILQAGDIVEVDANRGVVKKV